MSKTTKFYSLGIDMAKAERPIDFNADTLEKVLTGFEEYLSKKGITYTEPSFNEEGECIVKCSLDNAPVIADVRFYAMKDGENFSTPYEPVGRIDFYRFYTKENGEVTVKVPKGRYLIKVSKGSEYEIEYKTVEITDKKETFEFSLVRFTDLSTKGFYAGDIHHHSIYSSPVWGGDDDVKEEPWEAALSMAANGLGYGALSDHHNVLNHKVWKETKTKEFFPIPSKEISTSNGHVLSLGVDGYDVIYKIPEKKDRTDEYLRSEFVRITDEIKAKGGLPQLNHPRDLQVAISWNPNFYDLTDIFETVEIWNGSAPMYYGSTDAMAGDFWRMLLDEGRYIPATTGSDCHNTKADDYHKLFSKMMWLCAEAKKVLASSEVNKLSDSKAVLEDFVYICDKFLPRLEVWAKTTLTSGCVRTYVHIDGERTTPKILDALRKGHSFLTNGPVLLTKVNDAYMGESTKVKDGKVSLDITLMANRELTGLTAFLANGKAVSIPLKKLPTAKHYDYSFKLNDFEVGDSGYIFFVANGDCTNIAISNPVLLTK